MRAPVLLTALGLGALAMAAVLYGRVRWNADTRDLRAGLETARVAIEPTLFDAQALDGLPAPVQRYLRAALSDRQPIVAAVTLEHTGTFNMGEAADRWKPFSSNQRVVIRRPGFDWNASVSMLPGVPVRVHDAYVAGEGILHAAVLGLVSVVNMRGTPEMAEGELMRFLAETPWYPTALLPGPGIRWAAVDDRSARATLEDGSLGVTLLFSFDNQGLIETVRADARGRTVDGVTVPTPWQGRFWNYVTRDGMRVPLDGEVAWLLAEGPKPYWRGHITRLDYEFAQ